ncbi:MAG: hypothetical protein J6S52_02620, partial [Prevotella sp.]|nr:hypothetical protein [Prevotella sp.]
MQDNINKLYNVLKNDGYEDLGTEEKFRNFVNDTANVKKLYGVLKNDGYEDLGTEDQFISFVMPKQQASKPQGMIAAAIQAPEPPASIAKPENGLPLQKFDVAEQNQENAEKFRIQQEQTPFMRQQRAAKQQAEAMNKPAFPDIEAPQLSRSIGDDREKYKGMVTQAIRGAVKTKSETALSDAMRSTNEELARQGYDVEALQQSGLLNEGIENVLVPTAEAAVTKGTKIIDKVFDDAKNKALKARTEATRYNGMGGTSMMGAGLLMGEKAYNKEIDPDKLQQQLVNAIDKDGLRETFNEVYRQAVRYGIDPKEYFNTYVAPHLKENAARALDKFMTDQYMPKNDAEYILSGFSNSITGMLSDWLTKSAKQNAYKQMALSKYDASTGTQIAREAVGLLSSAPEFMISGGVASAVTKKVCGKAIQNIMAKGFTRMQAQRILTSELASKFGQRVAERIVQSSVSGSANFATLESMSEAARQLRDDDFNAGKIALKGVEGAGKGAIFGAVSGGYAGATSELTGATKVISNFLGIPANGLSLTLSSNAINEISKMMGGEDELMEVDAEGNSKRKSFMQQWADNTLLDLMMRGTSHHNFNVITREGRSDLTARMKSFFSPLSDSQKMFGKTWGSGMSEEGKARLMGITGTDNLRDALMSGVPKASDMPSLPFQAGRIDGKTRSRSVDDLLREEQRSVMQQNWDKIMHDRELAAADKAKLCMIMGAKFHTNPSVTMTTVTGADGEKYVEYRDAAGMLNERVPLYDADLGLEAQNKLRMRNIYGKTSALGKQGEYAVAAGAMRYAMEPDAEGKTPTEEQQKKRASEYFDRFRKGELTDMEITELEADLNKATLGYDGADKIKVIKHDDGTASVQYSKNGVPVRTDHFGTEEEANERASRDLYQQQLNSINEWREDVGIPLDDGSKLSIEQVYELKNNMPLGTLQQAIEGYPGMSMDEVRDKLLNSGLTSVDLVTGPDGIIRTAEQDKLIQDYYDWAKKTVEGMDAKKAQPDTEGLYQMGEGGAPDSITPAFKAPETPIAENGPGTEEERTYNGPTTEAQVQQPEAQLQQQPEVQPEQQPEAVPAAAPQNAIDENTSHGKAYSSGYNAVSANDLATVKAIKDNQELAARRVIDVVKNTNPVIENILSLTKQGKHAEAHALIDSTPMPEEQADALRQYIDADASVNGMQDAVEQIKDARIREYQAKVEAQAQENGEDVTILMLDGKNTQSCLVNGDLNNMSGTVMIRDLDENDNPVGEPHQVHVKQIKRVFPTQKVKDMIFAERKRIQQEIDAYFDNAVSPVNFEIGKKVVLKDGESIVEATVIGVNPDGSINFQSDTGEVHTIDRAEAERMATDGQEAGYGIRLQAEAEARAAARKQAEEQQKAQAEAEARRQAEEAARKAEEERRKNPLNRLKRREDNTIDYTNSNPDDVAELLQNLGAKGKTAAYQELAKVQDAIQAAEKEASAENTPDGIDALLAQEDRQDQRNARIDELKRQEAFWMDQISRIEAREEAIRKEEEHRAAEKLKREQQRQRSIAAFNKPINDARKRMADDPDAMQILEENNREPRTLKEAVADLIPKNGLVLKNWTDSYGRKHLGLEGELGMEAEDLKKLSYFMGKLENGATDITTLAERIYENLPESLQEQAPDGSRDIRDLIIELLSEAQNADHIIHYIDNARIREAEAVYDANKAAEAEYERAMAEHNQEVENETAPTYSAAEDPFSGSAGEAPFSFRGIKTDADRERHNERVRRVGGLILDSESEPIEEKTKTLLDTIGRQLGKAFVVDKKLADVNADGLSIDNVIYLSPKTVMDGDKFTRKISGHELTHAIKRSSKDVQEVWDKFLEFVQESISKEEYDKRVDEKLSLYRKELGKIISRRNKILEQANPTDEDLKFARKYANVKMPTREEMEEEVACDFVGEHILTDEKFINDLVERVELSKADSKSIIQRMRAFIDKMLAYLESLARPTSAERRARVALERARDIWADMYELVAAKQREDLIGNAEAGDEAFSLPKFSIIKSKDKELTEDDKKAIEDLNSGDKTKTKTVYRAMQVIDGKLYPPMAAKIDGKLVESAKEGDILKADEHPELIKMINGKPKFVLDKGGNDATGKKASSVPARYNPYWHTSNSPMNDQFKSAWIRPNLVTVECEIPVSELTSGYKAKYAKDAVGMVPWKSGSVTGELVKQGHPGREVYLSRYCKIGRTLTDAETAQMIKDFIGDKDVSIPENVVTPKVRAELEKIGVKIGEPEKGVNKTEQIEEAIANGLEVDKKTILGERGGAVSGNPSSKNLPLEGSEHLSHRALTLPKDAAKLQKNSEITIESAKKIINAGEFNRKTETAAQAVSALGHALHLEKSGSSQSYYQDYYEGDFIVDGKVARVRISTHPATNARIGNAPVDDKISIVIYKNGEHKDRGEHNGYVEYIYHPDNISPKDAAMAIVKSIEGLIKDGEYIDETGLAQRQEYPYVDDKGNVKFSIAQRDKEYADAVAAGDMEKVDAMLREEAARKGYSDNVDYQGSLAFNGAAPSRNGYFETRQERIEAFDNGDFEDTYSLGDFVETGLDNHDLEWQLANPIPASGRDKATLESIRNLNNAVKSKSGKIKMYRAVDADIKENSFRNGDWITPSREYAQKHIGLQDWKKGRVIEQEVSIDDVWWDGNDINEWGYDDGKGYVYKNTKNNRKLLEATYDDKGNLIPLSKRFDEKKSDVKFSFPKKKDTDGMVSDFQSREEADKAWKELEDKYDGLVWRNSKMTPEDAAKRDNALAVILNKSPEIKKVVEVKKPKPMTGYDMLSAEGKARDEIYRNRQLIDSRQHLQNTQRMFNGRIGDASAGAFNYKKEGSDDMIHGVADLEKAGMIGRAILYDLYDYKNKLLLVRNTGSQNKTRLRVFDGAIADVDKAIKWYKEFAEGKHMRLGEHEEDGIKFSISVTNSDPFYSNAARATADIKQNKATGDQWIAMIKKNGGLKAEEDKWMGLSDWLRGKKSVTKEEVEKFIAENAIKVEDVEYAEVQDIADNPKFRQYNEEYQEIIDNADRYYDKADAEYAKFMQEMQDKYGEDWANEMDEREQKLENRLLEQRSRFMDYDSNSIREIAYEVMCERHGDDFRDAFDLDYDGLAPSTDWNGNLTGQAKYFLEFKKEPIDSTRLLYTTEGLENKREIALTVPTIEPYNESDEIHFGEAGEGRAVAWIRFGDTEIHDPEIKKSLDSASKELYDYLDRMSEKYETNPDNPEQIEDKLTAEEKAEHQRIMANIRKYDEANDANTKKVLVIDEIQSKRHQDGRDKGYKIDEGKAWEISHDAFEALRKYDQELFEKYGTNDFKGKLTEEEKAKYAELVTDSELKKAEFRRQKEAVPDAPFQKTWHELAMKRMLRYAAENGYDKIAWTTGEQQADRYNLSGVVDHISYVTLPNGEIDARAYFKNGSYEPLGRTWEEVERNAGKDLARRMQQGEANSTENLEWGIDKDEHYVSYDYNVISGEGLKIGGEGMKGFYDRMLPQFMDKYGKKWGVKTGEVELDLPNEADRVMHSVDVTPEMKESVGQGQPMFSLSGPKSRDIVPTVRGGWNERKIKKYLKDYPTRSGVRLASKAISQFDSPEELKEHMFYHGTVYGGEHLKPSITMSDREIERIGGGGYGEKYWGISLSKSKKVASNFSGTSHYVRIYPMILLKDAKVIERPDFSDAYDAGEHIVELWNDGVDAVWIGDKNSGEQELLVLNPRAVVNIGTSDFYKVYKLGTQENPLRIADDAAINKMYETAKEFANTPGPIKPFKPLKPYPEYFRRLKNGELVMRDDQEVEEEYERRKAQYEKDMQEYERKMDEYENSEEVRKYKELKEKAYNDVRFSISAKEKEREQKREKQIKSKQFKDWFGDWEKDPEHASKMVDKDGKPLVVYHGSYWEPLKEEPGNAVFDDSFRGMASGDNGFFGRGFYFTFGNGDTSRWEARFYGPNVGEYYLNIRKPFMFAETMMDFKGDKISGDEKNSVMILNMVKHFPEFAKNYKLDAYDNMVEHTGEISLEDYAKKLMDVYENKEFIIHENVDRDNPDIIELCADPVVHKDHYADGTPFEWTDYGFEMKLVRPSKDEDAQLTFAHYYLTQHSDRLSGNDGRKEWYGVDNGMFHYLFESEEFTNELKKRGYDGVMQSKDGDEVVVFDANQIKSATENNGNFDRNNADIRFSFRVPEGKTKAQMQAETDRDIAQRRNVVREGDTYEDVLRKAKAVRDADELVKIEQTISDNQIKPGDSFEEVLRKAEALKTAAADQQKFAFSREERARQAYERDRKRQQKEINDAQKALRKKIVDEINYLMNDQHLTVFNKSTLSRLLKDVQNADADNIEQTVTSIRTEIDRLTDKSQQRQLEDLMKLKTRDQNGKGMAIAKNVSDSVRRILGMIQGRIVDLKSTGYEEDMTQLRRQNWFLPGENMRLRRTIERLQNEEPTAERTQDMIDAEIAEAEAKIKENEAQVEANKAELADLKVRKQEAESAKALASDADVAEEIAKLMEKMDEHVAGKGAWTPSDSEKLTALQILQLKQQADSKRREIEDMKRKLAELEDSLSRYQAEARRPQRYIPRQRMEQLEQQVQGMKQAINQATDELIGQNGNLIDIVKDLVEEGKSSLVNKIQAENNRKYDILHGVITDIMGDKQIPTDQQTKKEQLQEGKWKKFFSAQLHSFEYLAKRINENSLGEDGWFYNYFVKGKNGVMQAETNHQLGLRDAVETLDAKAQEIYGCSYTEASKRNAEVDNHSGVFIYRDANGMEIEEEQPLSKGQAMYIYMVWKMPDGKMKLQNQGFTDESLAQVREFLSPEDMQFADWIQDEFLKDRRAKYNDLYVELYNTSMANIENYVPLKILETEVKRDSNLSDDSGRKQTLEEKAGALIERKFNLSQVDITKNAFDVIAEHINNMEEWHAYARVRKDLDYVLSNTFVRNQLNANSAGRYNQLYDAAAIAAHAYKPNKAEHMDEVVGWLTKGLVGGNIAFRNSTALKQILSVPAFYGYCEDPKFWAALTANIGMQYVRNAPAVLANMATYGISGKAGFKLADKGKMKSLMSENIVWCMKNVPSFRNRVLKGTVGLEYMDQKLKGKVGELVDKYLDYGMATNQMIDAITCSVGIKSIFDYRYAKLSEGIEKDTSLTAEQKAEALEEAKRQAIMDADIYYNATQQSNHSAFMSPMQLSRSMINRAFSVYQNASIGYARKAVSAGQNVYKIARNFSKLQNEYARRYMAEDANMDRDEAMDKAHEYLTHKLTHNILNAFHYGYTMNWLWDLGSKGLLGLWWWSSQRDEDKEKELRKEAGLEDNIGLRAYDIAAKAGELATYPGRGLTGMNMASSLINGSLNNPLLLIDELDEMQQDVKKYLEDGNYAAIASQALFHGLKTSGFDARVHYNTLAGVYGMSKAALTGNQDSDFMINLMLALNTPNTNRRAVAEELYKDYPLDTYVSNIMEASKYTDNEYLALFPGMKLLTAKNQMQIYKEFAFNNLTDEEKA